MKRTVLTILLLATSLTLFTGCGKLTKEQTEYKENMDTFFKDVAALNESINNINTSSDNYDEELISYLYDLSSKVSTMSTYEVPDDFPYVQQLSINASNNMDKALTYYREAFSEERYNEDAASIAYEYYTEANSNIKYIIRILHGESYEDIKVSENMSSSPTNEFETTSGGEDEDDYSMYLEEDDNDYTVYNDPNYEEDISGEGNENEVTE